MEEITLLLNKFCNNNKKFPPPATLPDWISSGKSSAGLKSADTSTASREATSSALQIKSMHYIAQVINALHCIERSSKSTHQQLQEGRHHPYCTVCQWVKFKTDTSTALREATSSVLHSLSMHYIAMREVQNRHIKRDGIICIAQFINDRSSKVFSSDWLQNHHMRLFKRYSFLILFHTTFITIEELVLMKYVSRHHHRCANYDVLQKQIADSENSFNFPSLLFKAWISESFFMPGKQESGFLHKEAGVVSARDLLLMDRHILLFNFSNNSKTLKGRYTPVLDNRTFVWFTNYFKFCNCCTCITS